MRLDPDGAVRNKVPRLIYIFFNYCCGFLKPADHTDSFIPRTAQELFIPPVSLRFGDRKTIEKISKDNAPNFLIFFLYMCNTRIEKFNVGISILYNHFSRKSLTCMFPEVAPHKSLAKCTVIHSCGQCVTRRASFSAPSMHDSHSKVNFLVSWVWSAHRQGNFAGRLNGNWL